MIPVNVTDRVSLWLANDEVLYRNAKQICQMVGRANAPREVEKWFRNLVFYLFPDNPVGRMIIEECKPLDDVDWDEVVSGFFD